MPLTLRTKKIRQQKLRYNQLKNIIFDYIWSDHFDGDLSDFINYNTRDRLMKLEQQQYNTEFRSKPWRRLQRHINRIHRFAMEVYCDGEIDDYDHCLNGSEYEEFHLIRMKLYEY